MEESRSQVDQYAAQLRNKYGIRFVERIVDMCNAVDGILLESIDGRTHLAQAKEAVQCGKPLFIDKPLASTWSDAKAIDQAARAALVPWFSASSLRFSEIQSLKGEPVKGAIVWGPGPLEEHHQLDLFLVQHSRRGNAVYAHGDGDVPR